MRPVWRRRSSRTDGDPDTSYPVVNVLSSTRWEFSRALADMGLVILLVGTLLVALSGYFQIRQKFVSLLPAPLRDYFQSDQVEPIRPDTTAGRPHVADKLTKILPELGRSRPPAAGHFGVGSTPATVRSAQGTPTSETEALWTYGKSEVRFENGRVVTWYSAPENPLRVE